MKNYKEDLAALMHAVAKVADKFQHDSEQAITECDSQGLQFIRISKDNKKFTARYLLGGKERKLQIIKRKQGMLIRINIPDEMIPRT